MLVPG